MRMMEAMEALRGAAWLEGGFCGGGRGMGRDSQGSETEEQGYGGLGAAGELGLLEEPDG